jgi:hypothetical protein
MLEEERIGQLLLLGARPNYQEGKRRPTAYYCSASISSDSARGSNLKVA